MRYGRNCFGERTLRSILHSKFLTEVRHLDITLGHEVRVVGVQRKIDSTGVYKMPEIKEGYT